MPAPVLGILIEDHDIHRRAGGVERRETTEQSGIAVDRVERWRTELLEPPVALRVDPV
jgi:hypothetical protein